MTSTIIQHSTCIYTTAG